MGAAWVLLPSVLAAAGLALRPGWRHGRWAGVGASAATLAGACALPWAGDGMLRADTLATYLAVVAALVGLAAAWDGYRGAALHALVAAVLVALLAGDPALAWMAVAAAAMATATRAGAVPMAAGLLLALLGTVVPELVVPASVAGYGAVAVLSPAYARGAPAAGVLLPLVALSILLRLRGADDGFGPPLVLLGAGALAAGSVLLWRGGRLVRCSLLGHSGVVAIAFGLGGPIGGFAGLLHLGAHSLAHASLGRRTPAVLLLALAGLPPFGLFGSEVLLTMDAVRQGNGLFVPLAVGVLALSSATLARVRGGSHAVPWGPVAVLVLLGVMPAALASWLRAAVP